MSRRPLIGLTGRRKRGDQIVGNLPVLSEFPIDMYYANYTQAVINAGGMPVHIPVEVDPAEMAGYLDGMLLSGGADVGPERYGHESETDLYPPEVERDDLELALLQEAAETELPVLGICRGFQLINVHAGGTLHQHVPEHAGFETATDHLLHEVAFEPESALGAMYGVERMGVNSLHHQTVDAVGDGLRVTARADDGTPEGLEHTSLPFLSIQWHPEMLPSAPSDPVFAWLIDSASARS